jgi:hypothetical protein
MRHVFELTWECPLKEDGEPTPVPKLPNPEKWYTLGELAYNLGFESQEIERLRALNPDEEKARENLLGSRPSDRFQYDENDFDKFVTKIVKMYQSAKEITTSNSQPSMVVTGCGESIERRCGRNWSNAYKYDSPFLFLDLLTEPFHEKGDSISSLFVRKCVYLAFFGSNGSLRRRLRDAPAEDAETDVEIRPISTIDGGAQSSDSDESMASSSQDEMSCSEAPDILKRSLLDFPKSNNNSRTELTSLMECELPNNPHETHRGTVTSQGRPRSQSPSARMLRPLYRKRDWSSYRRHRVPNADSDNESGCNRDNEDAKTIGASGRAQPFSSKRLKAVGLLKMELQQDNQVR